VNDTFGVILGFVLSLTILSYLLLDDNILFRFGANVLVGVSAGYLLAVLCKKVLWDQYLAHPTLTLGNIFGLFLLTVLTLLMLSRVLPRGSGLAAVPMAFLVGVGAAVVVGGALTGTFLPQAAAAAQTNLLAYDPNADILTNLFNMAENWFVLAGTLATLAYFHFGARPRGGATVGQSSFIRPIAIFGKGVLMITLGVLYSGALLSALAILVERMYSLVLVVNLWLGG
jgi:hypothetical protein